MRRPSSLLAAVVVALAVVAVTLVVLALMASTSAAASPGDCDGKQRAANDAVLSGRFVIDANGALTTPATAPNLYTRDFAHRADFCFTVPDPGEYLLYANTIGVDTRSDSFFVEADGRLVTWHVPRSSTPAASYVQEAGSPVVFVFEQGEQQVSFFQRESGTGVTSLEIRQLRSTRSPVDPDCDGLEQEAEAGSVAGTVLVAIRTVTGSSNLASGDRYVAAPPWAPNNYSFNPTDRVEFCIDVPVTGEYALSARALGPGNYADSFFIQMDDDDEFVWHIPRSSSWTDFDVRRADTGATATFNLDAGQHRMRFVMRESATLLDKWELTQVGGPPPPTTYYVSCAGGDDDAAGTSTTTAWGSVDRANQVELQPGEALRFRRGCVFQGQLDVDDIGTAAEPITIGAYGGGSAPRLTSGDPTARIVELTGAHLVVADLAVVGQAAANFDPDCDDTPLGDIHGFSLAAPANNIVLRNVSATGGYAGVYIGPGAVNNRVLDSTITSNTMMGPLDAVPDNNDAGAFGILIWGDDNEIAGNSFSNNRACSYDYGIDGASVEIFGGQRNVIRDNRTVNDHTFTELGNARSADNVFEGNVYSSDKPGDTFLVTRGAEDGFGPIRGTIVRNNTAVLTGAGSQGVVCYAGCADDILTLTNNIVWGELKAAFSDGEFDDRDNLYWASDGTPFVQGPFDPSSVEADPLFVDAAAGDFSLTACSPAIPLAAGAIPYIGIPCPG